VSDVSVLGRNTQGVKMISLSKGELLVGIERIVSLNGEGEGEGEPMEEGTP